jgi:hypothetical protein
MTIVDCRVAPLGSGVCLITTSGSGRICGLNLDGTPRNNATQSTAYDLTLMGVDRAWDLIAPQGQVVNLVHDNVEVLIPKGTINEPAWRDIARTIASSEGSP